MILLHGIWNQPLVLQPLRQRLREQGFATETPGYASLLDGGECAAWRLAERLRLDARRGLPPAHLVGHSLGGLVALLAARDPSLPLGRIVCLGSPLAGSAAARGLVARGLRLGLGRSHALLAEGIERLPEEREIAVIAGTLPLGLGRWFGAEGAGDGTVLLAETRLPGLRHHLEVRASHTGLVWSRAVARATAAFLRSGRLAA